MLTELLEMVRQGSLDSRHSSDILKLIKRDLFGDYSFELADRFVTSGNLQAMAQDNVTPELLETNLQLVKALLQNFICPQRSFFGSMGPQAEK